MKQSRLFAPTLKEAPSDAVIVSHQLLLRAGFIKQVAAGIYTYLPLGKKVIDNIETIVRAEHTAIDCSELLMPALQPKELWDQSGRWDVYGGELMRLKDRHQRDFALGPTHEEVITTVVKDYLNSYKKLPLSVYQIQTKFRDEARPRFGLMRGREFIMKDAYSFHEDAASLDVEYDKFVQAYHNIFTRCGLDFRMVEADNGQMGGSGSAEFMALAEVGEDTIVYSTDGDFASNIEVHDLAVGEPAPVGNGTIQHAKGIELGHVFKLGTKYSESFGVTFLDVDQKKQALMMGCYGIGISRIMMAIVEQKNDEFGIIWPKNLAPFDVHVVPICTKTPEIIDHALDIYASLQQAGYDVLLDDRPERAGVKFKDSDLMGIPLRIVVGKSIADGSVQIANRQTGEKLEVKVEDLKEALSEIYANLK
ncbi:MAG: proline--tRNA ligase [Defluviitaleaceae bacterium]|nr:proline--tRNA ligase [Defluviitaleaceae bacterium]